MNNPCGILKDTINTIKTLKKINLCSGPVLLDDYINIDMGRNADVSLDLEKDLLPFPDESVDIVACISAINYFSRERAGQIIKDVYRVLKPGGIARFASQDLRILAEKYVNNDLDFYFEKLPDGRDRLPGRTIADKFNQFFYGFRCGDKHCNYVYDFESLRGLFEEAGFGLIEQKNYRESRISGIDRLDNRPEQMFFLEAIKGNVYTVFPDHNSNMSLKETDLSTPQEHCKTELVRENPESNKADMSRDNKLLLNKIAVKHLIINPQIVIDEVSKIFQNEKINDSDSLFKELVSNPQKVGLDREDLSGKCDRQKMEMVAGEYLAKLSRDISKIASAVLFNAQWNYGESEWFDHRHHLLDPDKWFTDYWTASADNVLLVLPLHGKLLDLCSGDGFYDYYFYRKRAKEVVCVEMNPYAYRHSCRLHKADNTTYIRQNVLAYEPRESYYDNVVVRGAIEHFSQAEQQVIINKAFKALKPGGWFCGDTPAKSKTNQKHLSAHKYEWADETEMRRELGRVFDHVETYSMASDDPSLVDFTTLFWRCRKAAENNRCIISEEDKNKLSSKQKYNDLQTADVTGMRDIALNMWQAGERDKAWQYLLKVLELDPANRLVVLKCAEILKSMDRFEDLKKLSINYLKLKPDDFEIKGILEETRTNLDKKLQNSDSLVQRRHELNKLNQRFNSIQPDLNHLSACLKWLVRAQEANEGGGVSAAYNIDSKRWDVDYPETTGYIIPTFLNYYKLTGIDSYRKRAIGMGDWEIAIQWPEGGVGEPVGVYGLRPRIFNTAQVMLGWLALYKETEQDKYLIAAQKAASWIIQNQDPDGKWTKSTYAGPKAYHIRVAWALLELHAIHRREPYQIAAERSINWVLAQGHINGWFANNSLAAPDKPWTHLIGYVLVGLMEIYRLNNAEFNRQKASSLLCNAAKALAGLYTELKEKNQGGQFLTLPETFDSNWSSSDVKSCLTGNAQIEFFLRRMFKYTDEPILKSAADLLIDDSKQLQLIDSIADPDIFGGLPGSYPIGAGYLGHAIPNWGVKFFADGLLQRLLPEHAQKYLG